MTSSLPKSLTATMLTMAAGAVICTLAPQAARADDAKKVADRVKIELKTPSSVTFDSHGRMSIRWSRGKSMAGDMAAAPASILTSVGKILWKDRDFRILETRTEKSRFGTVAYSTISLDGWPVIDQFVKVAAGSDGSFRDVVISIPADAAGLRVADARGRVNTATAGKTICAHAAQRFDGLICPDQVQRVWFMAEDGVLAPGGRMLLKGADMSRLFEAVVDLRTGKIVRFVDIARR